MSLAKIYSGAGVGVDAYPVEIEVNAGRRPDDRGGGTAGCGGEGSKDRVWTAVINSGLLAAGWGTTVNLAPADIKKEGPSFDLPIALGMLAANNDISKEALEGVCAVGELALSPSMNSGQAGQVRECAGCCRGDAGGGGRTAHGTGTGENAEEAAVVKGLKVYAIDNLRQAVAFLKRVGD